MHTYSINSDERKMIIATLAILSIGIVLIVKNYLILPHWVPVPSVFAIFGSFYWLFDKVMWKWPVIQELLSTPNLNGTWTIFLWSSRDNYSRGYKGTLTITQTWSKIHIFMDGEKTFGRSIMAGIEVDTPERFTLKWEYLSQRKPEFAQEEYMHYGITKVRNIPGKNSISKMEGDYYTDRSRHSSGPVIIEKGLVSLPE